MIDEQSPEIVQNSPKELPVISTNTNPPKEIQTAYKRSAERKNDLRKRPQELSERNKNLLSDYAKGMTVIELSNKYEISQVRVYAIVNRYKDIVTIDREHEKIRRVRELKRIENQSPKDMVAKDAKEFVAILEAQRKELEGTGEGSSITNINVIIDKIQIANLSDGDKLSKLRDLLGNG